MSVTRLHGLDGAGRATGHTIVIDTFRAFTTAAVLLERGVDPLMLCTTLDGAREIAADHGALLCGEEDGARPADFDLGNSPWEALERIDLDGAAVVMRTSAGTRCVLAARQNDASPVYAASLVVAAATVGRVSPGTVVTIVTAGLSGLERAEEDDLTADYIEDLLAGGADPGVTGVLIATTNRARTLREATWAHPEDVAIASEVDRYGFAMEAVERHGIVHLEPRW